jgi:hypothetical protein
MQAHDQYLLTAGEATQLPSITTPDNVTLFVRTHVSRRVYICCAYM